jgi:heterodisulfide reductase subunit B2
MKKYMFFPGCSSEGIAKPYMDSLNAIKDPLGISFEEIEDWNCCGATEYTSLHRLGSFALQGRNLAIAAQQAKEIDTRVVSASCSACYLNMLKVEHTMREDSELTDKVNEALAADGKHYEPGSLDVRHVLDIILNDVGLDEIRSKVVKPLTGLKVAAYYGCVIVRPDYENRFGNTEYPTVLEDLISALGAEPVDYPLRTHCCGGHMPSIKTSTAYELIRQLLDGAEKVDADMMITLCPMCQMNVDAYQSDVNRYFKTDFNMPILYFSQLMGIAFGKSFDELGIGKEFIDSKPALAKIGSAPKAEVSDARPVRKKEEGLPMPQMPAKSEVK